jgi:hypothetical protein
MAGSTDRVVDRASKSRLPSWLRTRWPESTLPAWAYVLALAAICAVSRLPQLLSPNLLADGDECVLGLMAKHVAQGKEFPIFFYGQHYAFSAVETVVSALGFLVAGVGAVQLKLAGLALWTAGIVFLFLALSRPLGAARGFWIAVLLVLNPAWSVWSMRMGGGYLTAFAASSVLVWLLARERETAWRWRVAGALTAVIYLAQPLWLPGVIPIVGVALVRRRRLPWALDYAAVTVAVALVIKIGTVAPDQPFERSHRGKSRVGGVAAGGREPNLPGVDRFALSVLGDRSARSCHDRAGGHLVGRAGGGGPDAVVPIDHPPVLCLVSLAIRLGGVDAGGRMGAACRA